jgi:hypothetical protein
MDPDLRRLYNAAYTPAIYERVRRQMAERLRTPDFAAPLDRPPEPFRLAETPVFFSPALSDRCERAAVEILAQLRRPQVIAEGAARIPPAFRVPELDREPHTLAIDFALVRGGGGELEPKLIECQGFPSLYAMQVVQGDIWGEVLGALPGLGRGWSTYWRGVDRARYLDLLRRTIVGDEDPASVVLVDIDPPAQKTRPDFLATEDLLGVRAVCVTELKREGRRLLAPLGGGGRGPGRYAPVRRIYNRVIFDELVAKQVQAPFDYHDSLAVTWVPHPNWYWIWSKAAMPLLDHPAVPRAHFLSDLERWPEDLERWVLKPLFAFAGKGVIVDVDRAALDAIPTAARGDWMLMEKVDYAPALMTPEGNGVKVELRVLFLRPDERGLVPATNLCRLSRAKMHGVDYNKDFDWVGSSVALWAGR